MCKNTQLVKFLDLGFTALADNFLEEEQLNQPEIQYPLNVDICKDCGLFQLGFVVSPELMFHENYPYESSITKTGREHFISMATGICDKFHILPDSLAIDIGSNVGVLLSGFKSKKLRVLGIEPSSNVAKLAVKNGIDTISEFFSSKLASKIHKKSGKASVITATNVFAHVNDLDDFVNGVDILLSEEGIMAIEAPYVGNLLNKLEYDTIYHEHLSYLSLKPMIKFFNRLGFDVFDVEMQSIHGGSLRYFVGRKGKKPISKNISEFISFEESQEIYSERRLEKFSNDVKNHRSELNDLLLDLKRKGKKIVGISAPAKGNTLLNYCKIGPETLDYVTERSILKIGKYTPGTHIPVYSDDKLLEDTPDYALLLAWNFAEEIIQNNGRYRNKGGKFIIPIPHPHII